MAEGVVLQNVSQEDLFPTSPYNFNATLHKPDHFPSADNVWEPGVRWQTMRWENAPLGLKFEDKGTIDRPRITLSIWSQGALQNDFTHSLLAEISYRFYLHLDLSAFNRNYQSDARLGPLINRWRGMRPINFNSLYEYLIIAIVLQNATVRRSVSMLQLLFENYGTLLSYDGRKLYCFWEPETIDEVSEQELRDLRIGYRAKSIKRVSEAFVRENIIETELRHKSKGEQREALLALYGIGPASVEYILTDVFHHLGEISHISPWEQKIYSKLFFDTEPDEPVFVEKLLEHINTRYNENSTLAVHYFWEDLFWKRKHESVEWLEKLIRL